MFLLRLYHVLSWCHPSRVCSVFTHATGRESLTAADEFLHVTHQNTTVLWEGVTNPSGFFRALLGFPVFLSLLVGFSHDSWFHLCFVEVISVHAHTVVLTCFACVYAHIRNRISITLNSSLCTDWSFHACPSVFWIMSMNMSMLTLSNYDWLNTYIPSIPAAICYGREYHLPEPLLFLCLFIASFLYDTGRQHAKPFFPSFSKQIMTAAHISTMLPPDTPKQEGY